MVKKTKTASIFSILKFPFHVVYQGLIYLLVLIHYILSFIRHFITKNNIDKMSGVEFEKYVAYLLKQNGYTNVELTQASNDYGIDILAMKKDVLYAFQCKKYTSKVGIDAIRQVSTGCIYYDHDIPVVITNSTFTKQALKLADTLEVELWDKETLTGLILHSHYAKYRKWLLYSWFVFFSFSICFFFWMKNGMIEIFYSLIILLSLEVFCLFQAIFHRKKIDYKSFMV